MLGLPFASAAGDLPQGYQKNDWRTDTLNPFMPGSSSIWLGNDAKNYTAQIIGLSLGYRFR